MSHFFKLKAQKKIKENGERGEKEKKIKYQRVKVKNSDSLIL
jgi:hypothetical protein